MRRVLLLCVWASSSVAFADICRWECRWITIDGIPAYECKLIFPKDEVEFEEAPDMGEPSLPGTRGSANGSCKGTMRENTFRVFVGSGKSEGVPVKGRWGNSFEVDIVLTQYFADIEGELFYPTQPGKRAKIDMKAGPNRVVANTPGFHQEGTWNYTATATVTCTREDPYSSIIEPQYAHVSMYPSTTIGEMAGSPCSETKVSTGKYLPQVLDTVGCSEGGGILGHQGEKTLKCSAEANIGGLLKVTVGQNFKESYDIIKPMPTGMQGCLWMSQRGRSR